jgi:hypothetical protein
MQTHPHTHTQTWTRKYLLSYRRAHEHDDALATVLVLTMLQRQLRNLTGCRHGGLTT